MPPHESRAQAVREFNRFYTRRVGALGEAYLGSEFSLTECRVLFELAHRDHLTAAEVADTLSLDRGYLSRLLRSFKRRKLIATETSSKDRRHTLLSLTAAGRKAFAPIDRGALDVTTALLRPLSDPAQRRLLAAMRDITTTLAPADSTREASYELRTHRPGDMGWVVQRHADVYCGEYGWDERFEALCARVVAEFIDNFDPKRERCWIAERDGERVGSIFVVAKSKTVAKLRLLLVDPSARGLGIGQRLVDEVIAFARNVGYRKILLWTQSDLASARRIYNAKGFVLVGTERHEMFGSPLVAETWELKL